MSTSSKRRKKSTAVTGETNSEFAAHVQSQYAAGMERLEQQHVEAQAALDAVQRSWDSPAVDEHQTTIEDEIAAELDEDKIYEFKDDGLGWRPAESGKEDQTGEKG